MFINYILSVESLRMQLVDMKCRKKVTPIKKLNTTETVQYIAVPTTEY